MLLLYTPQNSDLVSIRACVVVKLPKTTNKVNHFTCKQLGYVALFVLLLLIGIALQKFSASFCISRFLYINKLYNDFPVALV